jgi:hypothetical protein
MVKELPHMLNFTSNTLTKQCSLCAKAYPLTEKYYRSNGDGLEATCRFCQIRARIKTRGTRGLRTGTIYFISDKAMTTVKIGFTQNPIAQRLDTLQSLSPKPLRLLGTIDGVEADETLLHREFSSDRQHGEWFALTPEIKQFIDVATTLPKNKDINPRPRYRFEFWLDSNKNDELLLMEEIAALKKKRLFAQTIRDGIRLIVDLRRGSFDVLVELFPEMRYYINEREY